MIYVADQRRGAVLELSALEEGTAYRWLLSDAVTVGPMTRPSGMALNLDQCLVVTDSANNRLLIINPDAGSSVALDSTGSDIGSLRQPTGVAIAASGRLVVADTGNHRVAFKEPLVARTWSAYGTPGRISPGGFVAPSDVHVDRAGRILVADPGADRLVRINAPDGSGWTALTLPQGRKSPRPYALANGPNGSVLITDLVNSRILLLAADDTVNVLIDGAADRSLIAVAVAMLAQTLVATRPLHHQPLDTVRRSADGRRREPGQRWAQRRPTF
jgi:DNA-binding beta-propeller fold protein YncE